MQERVLAPPLRSTGVMAAADRRELAQRADELQAALYAGWSVRDLVSVFREEIGIEVSATTIQTALRQAADKRSGKNRRPRTKRPAGQAVNQAEKQTRNRSETQPVVSASATNSTPRFTPVTNASVTTSATVPNAQPVKPEATASQSPASFGTTLTQGAAKRGAKEKIRDGCRPVALWRLSA